MGTKTAKIFRQNIAKLMQETGVSQNALAEQCGITQATLSRCITGKTTPDLETIDMLAQYFKVSVSRLLADEKEDAATWKPIEPALRKILLAIKKARQSLAEIERVLEGMV